MSGIVMFILMMIIGCIAPGLIEIWVDTIGQQIPGPILLAIAIIIISAMAYFIVKEESK